MEGLKLVWGWQWQRGKETGESGSAAEAQLVDPLSNLMERSSVLPKALCFFQWLSFEGLC